MLSSQMVIVKSPICYEVIGSGIKQTISGEEMYPLITLWFAVWLLVQWLVYNLFDYVHQKPYTPLCGSVTYV